MVAMLSPGLAGSYISHAAAGSIVQECMHAIERRRTFE
jgi:hypothetical protein